MTNTADAQARADAIEGGAIRYRTSCPCKHGHCSERYTLTGACVECTIGRAMNRYERTRALVSAARLAAAQKTAA